MSWLEGLDSLGESIGSEGAAAYTRGAIIGWGARAGLSGRSTLAAIRQAGVGVGSSTFWNLWHGVQDQIAAGRTSASIPFDASTGELLPGEPPAGWTGRYVHQVTAQYRHRTDAGETVIESKTIGVLSSSPLTPQQATSGAMDILSTPGSTVGGTEIPDTSDLVTLSLTGAWYHVRPGVTP